MAEQLQINVRVHLKEGDIKRKIEDQLKGLKDINVDGAARINARLSSKSLNGIKKQLDEAIKGHSKRITIHTDVKGDKAINNLTRNLRELQKLAAKPIQIHASVVGAGADKALEKAIAKGGKQTGNVKIRTQVQGVANAQREINSLKRNARDLYQEIERINGAKNKISPSKMTDDIAKHYKDQMHEVEVALQATQNRLAKAYQATGMGKTESLEKAAAVMKSVMRFDGKVVNFRIAAHEQGFKTAVKDAEASMKKLLSLQKELQKAQRGAAKPGLSNQERRAYAERKKFLDGQIEATQKLAYANKQFDRTAYQTALKDMQTSHNIAMAGDMQKKKSFGRRGGFNDSYNTWSMLQTAGYSLAGIISSMNEVDRAVTKVTKVVPDSQKAINKWTKSIYKDASSVGKSVPEYANAVEQWATAGYNLKQSNALAKRSVMGSFVGDVDVNDMVNYMAVPLNSFKKQHLKADDIINSMNEVSNKHAVEMTDLGQAYSKASAVVSATGTTFGQLTGMITGAQEATRAGGDVIGRSIKAISQNFAKMSSGVTATDKKRAEFFHGLGVDLKDSNGKMKSTYQVMDDLSKVWGKLSKQQKQDAALYAAGKEHSAQFTGMLNNWDTVKQATAEAEGQTGLGKNGSAYQEMEKQKKSIQFQLAALGNNWRQFLANLTGGRSGIADMLGMANQFLGIGQKLTSSQGIMSATRWVAMAGGIMVARRALGGLLSNFGQYLGHGGKNASLFEQLTGLGETRERTSEAYGNFKSKVNEASAAFGRGPVFRGVDGIKQVSGTSKGTQAEFDEYTKSTKKASAAQKELGNSAKSAAKGTSELNTIVGLNNKPLEKMTKGGERAAGTIGKLKKVGSAAGAAFGMLGAGLGYVGIAMDAITLFGVAMQAMGVHPLQALQKAFNPAQEAARQFNKTLDKTSATIDKNNSAIEKNGIVTGQLSSSMKSIQSMKDTVNAMAPGGKIDSDTFESIKDQYNKIAKANGLELRIHGDDSTDNVKAKVNAIDTSMQDVKIQELQDLGKAFSKNVNAIDKSMGSNGIGRLLSQFSSGPNGHRIEKEHGLHGTFYNEVDKNGKFVKSYDNKKDLPSWYSANQLYGEGNARIWNSVEGKKLSQNVAKAQRGIREAISGLVDSYTDGTLTKGDMSSMNARERGALGVGMAARLRDFKDDPNSEGATKAKDQLKEVLSGLGVSDKRISNIQKDALDKYGNGALLKDLFGSGVDKQIVAAMANIGAQYQQQHSNQKGGWQGAAVRDQKAVDNYLKKHDGAQNTRGLIDPNTGFVNYQRLAEFTAGKANQQKGRTMLKAIGGKYGTNGANKNVMSSDQALALTTGLSGDATQLVEDYVTGKGTVSAAATIAANANGGKKARGSDIEYGVINSRGGNGKNTTRKQFASGLQEALTNGTLTDAQVNAAQKEYDANFTRNGTAKTVKGLKQKLVQGQKLTADTFKEMTKGLSKAERKKALEAAIKNGNIGKETQKELEKGKGSKKWRNGGKGRTEDDDSDAQGRTKKTKKKKKPTSDDDDGKSSSHKKKPHSSSQNNNQRPASSRAGSVNTQGYIRGLAKAGNSMSKWFGQTGKNFQKWFGNNRTLQSATKGFQKGGLLGGSLNLAKMGLKGLGNLTLGKSGMKSLNNMFKGLGKIKLPNFSKMFSGAKNPFKGLEKSFSRLNPFKGLSKMFSGKGNPLDKLFGKGKNNKVKVKADVDTKGVSSKLKKVGKNQKVKVKADVDTKNVKGKLQKAGKGAKVKVKADVDAKNVKGKLQKAGKGTKVKVKTDADTAGLKSKIKSAAKGQKAKVKVDADTSGVKGKIKAAVSGMKATVKVNVSANTGKLNALKSALAGISSKRVSVSASVKGTGKVNSLKSAINGVHSKHVTVAAKTKGLGNVRALQAAIDSVHGKSVTVSVTKSITITTHHKKGKSVGIGSIPAGVSADVGVGAGPTQAVGMGTPGSVTNYSAGGDDQTVNEDYWRYMDKQLYTGLPLDEQINKLENTVTQADEDMDKLISVAKQRIDVDNRQIAYQKQMQAAYQQEVTDMINKLHGFGFQSNGNRITNLGHAKDIKGDNASKVDEYLGKYQTAYQNLSEATKTIQDLQTDIWQQGKNQDDYRNTKDQKMVEKLQRSLEILNTVVENHKSIMERYAESLTDLDYVMKNKNNADQIMTKSEDVYQLMQKFNELSKANFVGTKEADNAQNLYESLQSIRDSVMENLDAIEELKKSMRDNQIAAVADNLARYTDNLNDSIDRLKNNVTNLEDGLLSGTDYTDLISSSFDVASFDQRTAYEKNVEDRIALEKQFDAALDAFAKKNVDRTAQVANQELQINFQKYNELAKMAQDFANKTLTSIEPIRVQFESKGSASDIDIPGITRNKEYQKTSEEYQKRMNALKEEYANKLDRANTASAKEALNQEMVYKQLNLQEQVLKEEISADQKAIATLQQMAKDPSMNSEQLKNIKDQIREYTDNAIEAQNNIKDAIKQRFEYEKQLIDQTLDKYQRMSETVSNLVTIADALNLDGATQARLIGRQIDADMDRYDLYLEKIAKIRQEMSQYEKGSFEYNQLSEMVEGYQADLESLITTLLDETRTQFKKSLDENMKAVQRNTYGGKTMDQAKFDQDLWYTRSQKELRIEEMRLKITELEDKTIDKKIGALDRQERLSKAEADYVDKQLDLALAQQKLNNALHKRDVQTITKTADGRFQNTYVYDQAQVDDARKEVNTDKQQLEDLKQSEINDFNTKFKEIIDAMTDGSVNQDEAKREIQDLAKSKEFVLGDIKGFDPTLLEKPIEAYNKFVETNKNILNRASGNSTISSNNNYQDLMKGFTEQFKAVSKDLGEIFGKELKTILYRPENAGFIGGGTTNSLSIQNMTVTLPNVRDIDEFREALNTLPQVAAQKATSK